MQAIATTNVHRYPAIALWIAFVATLAAPSALAQMNEAMVVERPELIDPEFSQSRAMITWVDREGQLWLAAINRNTGMLVPRGGKGLLIDPDAMGTADFDIIGNGPEWVGTSTGDQVVYTKFLPGLPHELRNARLALAQQSPEGSWSHGFIDRWRQRSAPYASSVALDPAPRISYVDLRGRHLWRDLHDPSSETLVQQYPRAYFYMMHFVKHTRAAAFVAPVDGVSQVFFYWLDEDRAEQITFDGGQKDLHSRPWIWQAPEYGGAYVLATIVDDRELRLYVLPPGGTQNDWTVINSIRTPQDGLINSPEPFIHNGASYLLFAASMPPTTYSSTIFLVSIDGSTPTQLTPNDPLRIRTDPEVFVANDGPYIYYNRATVIGNGNRFCLRCSEGLYRTYTGLPPAE